MRNIFTGLFSTQPRTRENFGGIGKLQWIEGAAHALHGLKIGLAEHPGHHFLFVLANAMLSGNRTTRGDAKIENAIGEDLGGVLLAGNSTVVQNQGMQVSVASVKDIGDAEASLLTEKVDFAEDAGQGSAGDDAVLHDVICGNA